MLEVSFKGRAQGREREKWKQCAKEVNDKLCGWNQSCVHWTEARRKAICDGTDENGGIWNTQKTDGLRKKSNPVAISG